MEVTAKLKYLRIAPRKVRLVANLVRGKKVEEAQTILNFTIKKSAKPILKLLNSAAANARNNLQLDLSNLYISKITVNQGPKYKRWMPRARGRVSEIQKRTSHITLVLKEATTAKKAKKAKKPKETKEARKPFAAKEKAKTWKEAKKEELPKPKQERGIKKFFRRKAF